MAERSDDSIKRLVGQLEWTADELEAQRPFITRLSEVQLTAAPVAGEPSIREHYESLLRRERQQHLPVVVEMAAAGGDAAGLLEPGEPDEIDTLDELLSTLVKYRRRLVDIVKTMDGDAWTRSVPDGSVTLETFLYQAALNDGEVLRRIGERLYESDLRLTDDNP